MQIFSFVVWFIQEFYMYTIVLIAISIAAVIEGIYLTRKNQRLLRRIASYESHVEVLRLDGAAINMEDACSSTLLPGDVIKVGEPTCPNIDDGRQGWNGCMSRIELSHPHSSPACLAIPVLVIDLATAGSGYVVPW